MPFCSVKDALLNGKRAPFEMRFVTYWKRVSYKAENNRLWMKSQLLVASFCKTISYTVVRLYIKR